MNEIATALTSIKTAIDIAKLIKESSSTLAEAEQKLKLAELISALADVKLEMSEVQSLLTEKNLKITDLKDALEVKQKLVYEAPYYWIQDGEEKDGPYCQHCQDADKKLIRLQKRGTGRWLCRACKGQFTDKNYVKPKPKPRGGGFLFS